MTQSDFTSSDSIAAQTPNLQTPNLSSIALAANNLWFAYPNHSPILKSLSITVTAGERVGVIGPNGAGKTTFFMSLCSVLTPTQGEVTLFDRPIEPGVFRPEIGFVFQNPSDQLFCASVREDVAFGPENMGLTPDEVAPRVHDALRITGMTDYIDRSPHHLSGGEKRMVAIAAVLAMQPRLVIYDEPSASLDMRARRRLIQFLLQAPETMLISSHDLEFLLEVCDRVVLLDDGQIIADGDPRDIMGDGDLMLAHGLEKPHSLVPHVEAHHD